MKILEVNGYLPPIRFTNRQLLDVYGLDKDQIKSSTGIEARHMVTGEMSLVDLAWNSLSSISDKVQNSDGIIFVTSKHEEALPNVSSQLHKRLGIKKHIFTVDINAACTGFVYALKIAQDMMKADNNLKQLLIVSAEKLSPLLDWNDKVNSFLFGDGSVSVLVERSDKRYVTEIYNNPDYNDLIYTYNNHFRCGDQKTFMKGVYSMAPNINKFFEDNNIDKSECLFMFHNANKKILDFLYSVLKIPKTNIGEETIHYTANMAAASLPYTLYKNLPNINNYRAILMIAMGAGFNYGISYMEI